MNEKGEGKINYNNKKHRNMVQFETTVRWMDGWMERLNEEGDYLSLVLFFRCTKNQRWYSG